jgi:hypothetical protein
MDELVKRTVKGVRQQPGEPVVEPHGLKANGLRREGYCSRSIERLPESRKHHEVRVSRHAIQPARAERRQPVLVLEPPERALDGAALTVQPLPLIGPTA